MYISFLTLSALVATFSALTLPETKIGDALFISNTDSDINAQVEGRSSILATGLCLAQTNAARAQNNVPPLTADTRLETASRNHNNVMVSQNCFDHQCPGEQPFGDRIRATGYTFSRAGENIAAGYADCNAVVNGWMNSPGHRANILNREYLHVGCHMAPCSGCTFRTYFTCDYARPR